jgi:hypothetical protein
MKLLQRQEGQASLGVTQRYVHLDKALAVAADEVSGYMLELLLGGARRSLALRVGR